MMLMMMMMIMHNQHRHSLTVNISAIHNIVCETMSTSNAIYSNFVAFCDSLSISNYVGNSSFLVIFGIVSMFFLFRSKHFRRLFLFQFSVCSFCVCAVGTCFVRPLATIRSILNQYFIPNCCRWRFIFCIHVFLLLFFFSLCNQFRSGTELPTFVYCYNISVVDIIFE